MAKMKQYLRINLIMHIRYHRANMRLQDTIDYENQTNRKGINYNKRLAENIGEHIQRNSTERLNNLYK